MSIILSLEEYAKIKQTYFDLGVKIMHEEFKKRGARMDEDLWPIFVDDRVVTLP